MKESAADIFAKIALEKKLLDRAALDRVREAQREARKKKRALTIEQACLDLGVLTRDQVRGLERGIRYYFVRKADKIYGKVAVEKGFIDADTVKNCLSKQHDEFFKRKKLVRISKLLAGLDAITPAEDAEVRAVVVSRLTPEESAHEAAAVTEEEAAAAVAEAGRQAISDAEIEAADAVAAHADLDGATAPGGAPPAGAGGAASPSGSASGSDVGSDASDPGDSADPLGAPPAPPAAEDDFSDDDTQILGREDGPGDATAARKAGSGTALKQKK